MEFPIVDHHKEMSVDRARDKTRPNLREMLSGMRRTAQGKIVEEMQRKEHLMSLSHVIHQRHLSYIMRTLLKILGVFVALQVVIVIVLEIVSARRKRPWQEGRAS